MIRAKVNIETAKRNYGPGEIIREQLSDADIAFLKKHGFITEETEAVPDTTEDDFLNDGEKPEFSLEADSGEDGDGEESGTEYKDEAAIKKLNKDEIVDYAKSIGLAIDPGMLKNDMIDAVLNHIGEQEA